jgi:hypothetical protein
MADNRDFDGELTKAVSGSLIAGRIVVMAVAIAIASVAVHGFGALALIKTDKPALQWLFWLNYLIRGIGWVIGAYFVLAGMTTICKMAVGRESGQSWNIVSGIIDIFGNLFVVFFATVRYLFWFVAFLIVIWGLGFFGRIPEFGPIIYGIALGLVSVAAAWWVALHVVKFFGSTLILPGIIATTGQKGISCFKEAKRVISSQPVRMIKRFLAVGLAFVLFSFVVARGIVFLQKSGGKAMGNKNGAVLNGAPTVRYLPVIPDYNVLPVVGAIQMGDAIGQNNATGTRLAGAWIFGIELIILLLVLKAVAANFFTLAGMSTYNALKGEPDAGITAPDVDLSKLKGSFGAVGAKFREEMKEGGSSPEPKKKAAPKKEEGD